MPHALVAPVAFDLQSPAFKAAPWPGLAKLRDQGPIVPLKMPIVGRVWATTTHAATEAMVKDRELFVQEGHNAGLPGRGAAGLQWWMPRTLKLLANNMLTRDDPDHRRLRKLVDRAFARRGIRAMRPDVEALADRLLDPIEAELRAGRPVDLIETYARRLPLGVICTLLGIPEGDREDFSAWTRATASTAGPLSLLRAVGPMRAMAAYIERQIEGAREHSSEGLIGELVRAEEDGDKLTTDELIAMVSLLLVAGFETTTHLIGDAVIALEAHPEKKAWLLDDPSERMERAVEELGRYTTPIQMTKPRYVARDATFMGQPLERGEYVLPLLAAANADPAMFDAPDELRLDRFPNPHLVFSSGVHFCLGMQLARIEAQVAIERLYARLPGIGIAVPAGALEWTPRLGTRGVTHLPLRLPVPVPARSAA